MSKVILSDEEGGLMEGLVTNIFIVATGEDPAPPPFYRDEGKI